MTVSSTAVRPRHGFYALGCVCFGIGVGYFLVRRGGLETALEAFMIAGLSTLVLYTGYDLSDRPISASGQWRALLIGIGVAAAFTLLAFAVWLTWRIGDGGSAKLPFLLSFAATLGAAVGSWSGLYVVQSNERLTQSRELAKLLRINQRVLRHNLRNELAISLGHLENVEEATAGTEVEADVDVIRDHLEELLETTDRTRRIVSIWETDDVLELDLAAVVEEQLDDLRTDRPTADVTADLPAECRVRAHSALPYAVREALENAVDHNPPDVSVRVTIDASADDEAVLEVADTGTGISQYDRDAIGLPEETPLTHARGLGLWIIYWTVETSNGTVEFDDNDPEGTVVRMSLPRASRSLSSTDLGDPAGS